MKVKAIYQHVFNVTREVEVDADGFKEWADDQYGEGNYDTDLALAAYIDRLDHEFVADTVFPDWRIDSPLPHDFELQHSDVIDAFVEETEVVAS